MSNGNWLGESTGKTETTVSDESGEFPRASPGSLFADHSWSQFV